MDATQYRSAIKALGLNQTKAALFLGISGSSSRRYAEAASPVPEQIAMLLSVMLHLEISPIQARETAALPVGDYRDGRIKSSNPCPKGSD
jgi:hypothetical protein